MDPIRDGLRRSASWLVGEMRAAGLDASVAHVWRELAEALSPRS